MPYNGTEREKQRSREWNRRNPDKVKLYRERENERRRAARADPEVRGKEALAKRAKRGGRTPEEQLKYETERQRVYRANYVKKLDKTPYQRLREKMEADPEFAAKQRKRWAEAAKRRHEKNPKRTETAEERDARLRRAREASVAKARETRRKKELERLASPPPPKELTPKAPPKPKSTVNVKRKPGRLLAIIGWRGL